MKAFVVIWNDRHMDTDVTVFLDSDKAIEWARKQAREYDPFNDYQETVLTQDMKKCGWIFDVKYSCENDGLCVVEKDVIE